MFGLVILTIGNTYSDKGAFIYCYRTNLHQNLHSFLHLEVTTPGCRICKFKQKLGSVLLYQYGIRHIW